MKYLTKQKSLLASSAITLACFASTPAFAGGGINPLRIFAGGAAATAFFIGANVGQSSIDPEVKSCCGGIKSADIDAQDPGFKLTGGYNFNKRVAVEGFYSDLGKSDIKVGGNKLGTVDYKTYGIAGVYTKPLTQQLRLRGKLGYGSLTSDFKGAGEVKHKKEDGGFFYKGIGAEYQFNKTLSAVVDYDHFDKDSQLLSAGVRFSF